MELDSADLNALYQTILSHFGDTALLTDDQGNLTYVCPNANRIFGYSVDEMSQFTHIEQLVGPSFRQLVNTIHNPAYPIAQPSLSVQQMIQPDGGQARLLSIQVHAVTLAEGTLLWVCRDITERPPTKPPTADMSQYKRAEEERRSFFELSLDMLCVGGFDGRYKQVSAACQSILGYTEADLIARPFLEFVHPDDRRATLTVLKRLQTGETIQNFENRYRCKDGSYRWLLWNGIALLDRQLVYSIARDITERKHTEEALRQQAERDRLISRITLKIHQSIDLREILTTTVAEIRQFFQSDRVLIYQFQPDGSGVIVVESVGNGWASVVGTVIHDCHFATHYADLYRQGRVQALTDIHTADLTRCHTDLLASLQVRANLAVPIVQEENFKLWGLLVVQQCAHPRQWQSFEIDLLKQLATQAAIAIQRSELYQQAQTEITHRQQAEAALRQQFERERLVGMIAQRIRQSLDLDTILNTTVAEVRQFLQVDRVLIYRVWPNGTGSAVTEAVAAGWPRILGQTFPEEVFPVESQRLYTQGRVIAIADIAQAHVPDCLLDFVRQFGVQAKLVVPILQQQGLWGLLVAHHCSTPRPWQILEVELLRQLATQVGIAIQQSELYQQVRQLNSSLEEQVQERTTQLQQALEFESLLKRITDKVRDSLDENQILQTAVRELGIALEVECCDTSIYDLEQLTATIQHEYTTSVPDAQGQVLSLTEPESIYYQLLQGRYIQACDIGSALIRDLRRRFAILACPLADDRGILGDLWLLRPADQTFSESEIRLVQQVANHCAIALRQAQLYQAAQSQVEELERLNQLKDDFLNTVSHELRTPMSSIQMATQMLEVTLQREGYPQLANTKVGRYLDILQTECYREIHLINDLLDLSRLDAGTEPLAMTTIDPQLWIAHIAEPFQARAHQQQQILQVHLPETLPALTTDLSCLERILSELLHNACKYTPAGGSISMSAHTEADTLYIQVCNTGIEIPPIECDRIFDKFYRIPNNDPWKHGGTGLGLALVKKLVEYLGGSIQAESHSNQVMFRVTVPYTAEEGSASDTLFL